MILALLALLVGGQVATIEFLKTLQVLSPGTTDLILDETFHTRSWLSANETAGAGPADAGRHVRSGAGRDVRPNSVRESHNDLSTARA